MTPLPERLPRYNYDPPTGKIKLDGIAVNIPEGTGRPDGMTIDKKRQLWVAQWEGHGVYCYDPNTGKLLTRIEVPLRMSLHVLSAGRAWIYYLLQQPAPA